MRYNFHRFLFARPVVLQIDWWKHVCGYSVLESLPSLKTAQQLHAYALLTLALLNFHILLYSYMHVYEGQFMTSTLNVFSPFLKVCSSA